MTREAFLSIRHVLRPGGALVINSFGNLGPGHDFFVSSLDRTLKSVFTSVHLHTDTIDGGMFFVASDRSPLVFAHQPDLQSVHPAKVQETEASYDHIVETVHDENGLVLTDDYNPAEFYDAWNREQLRKRLALRAKTM